MSEQPLYEAPASATVKVIDEVGYEFLVTTRAHTMKDLLANVAILREYLSGHGWAPADGIRQPAPGSQANGNGNGDYGMSFPAEKLTASMHDGNLYWKVKGGKFQKFGVTVWPEVLAEAGYNLDELNPLEEMSMAGMVAYYALNDKGNPGKVTRLQPVGG